MCKLHNEVFEVAETRINTECFLPIREGVSELNERTECHFSFPPYTGGCIGRLFWTVKLSMVSSLYGRVYQTDKLWNSFDMCFLPIREGVSRFSWIYSFQILFPPYTGGCIVNQNVLVGLQIVSSLYGRVYRSDLRERENR